MREWAGWWETGIPAGGRQGYRQGCAHTSLLLTLELPHLCGAIITGLAPITCSSSPHPRAIAELAEADDAALLEEMASRVALP